MNYPDIGFTPEYQELFKDTAFGGEMCHFNHGDIDYRYYKRPIPGTPYFDVVSPYGYSGPVQVAESADWPWFLANLHSYFYNAGIIAEFARLHPWERQPMQWQDFEGQQVEVLYDKITHGPPYHYEHDVWYIDLTQTEEQIWAGLDKGCRGAIKKAERIGVKVGLGDWDSDDVICFDLLYLQTMTRANAHTQYAVLGHLFNDLKPVMWKAIYQHKMIAGILLWVHGNYAHYYLSCSNGQFRSSGASNLILWEAIKWAKSQGCKVFNLGGGLSAGDSLESFKRSFTKTSKPFFTYRKIHNPEVYDDLCKAKGIDPQSEGFFPRYRSFDGK